MVTEISQASWPSGSLTKTKVKRSTFNGTWQALVVALLQSLEGVVFPLIMVVPTIYTMLNVQHYDVAVAVSATVAMETFTLVGTILINGPRKWIASFGHLKKKSGRLIVYAVICGTVTGNICFKAAVLLGGASYGTILSSFYPVAAILGAAWFFKQKYDHRTYWFGGLNALLGCLFVVLPIVITSGNENFVFAQQGVAMLLSLLSAIFWAIEALLIRMATRDKTISDKQVVSIRTTVALVMNAVVILPLSGAISPNPHNPYETFAAVLNHYEVWLICLALGISLLALRMAHTAALNNIGTAKTSVIDANYLVLTPCFAYLAAYFVGLADTDPNAHLHLVWLQLQKDLIPWWAFIIVVGIVLSLLPTLYFAAKTDTGPHSLKDQFS